MTEIGQQPDAILAWRDTTSCPKCGEERMYTNALVKYEPSFESCNCSRGLVPDEHLELMCFKCTYIQPMKTKDWAGE